jgi:hypothetical protein
MKLFCIEKLKKNAPLDLQSCGNREFQLIIIQLKIINKLAIP